MKVPGLEYREITNKPTNKTHDFIPGNNISDPLKRLENRERSIYRQRNGMHDGERLTMAVVNEKRKQGTLFTPVIHKTDFSFEKLSVGVIS